jgi:hypothetical protein
MMVAALFVRRDSIYKTILGVDAWDKDRDARKWPGGCPVVAHPPCAQWGNFSSMAKVDLAEKDLAIYAVAMVQKYGGVLEHPINSKLWRAARLPRVGMADEYGGFTLPISQSWWGHRAQKMTKLYIVGCHWRHFPPIWLSLGDPTNTVENMGKAERERTPPAFAHWLVELAHICARRDFTFAGADLSRQVPSLTRTASPQGVREGSQPPTPLDACSTNAKEPK